MERDIECLVLLLQWTAVNSVYRIDFSASGLASTLYTTTNSEVHSLPVVGPGDDHVIGRVAQVETRDASRVRMHRRARLECAQVKQRNLSEKVGHADITKS